MVMIAVDLTEPTDSRDLREVYIKIENHVWLVPLVGVGSIVDRIRAYAAEMQPEDMSPIPLDGCTIALPPDGLIRLADRLDEVAGSNLDR